MLAKIAVIIIIAALGMAFLMMIISVIGLVSDFGSEIRKPTNRTDAILKTERPMFEIPKSTTEIGEPFRGINASEPSVFYRYDPELSQCVAGCRKGERNPYVEKLMRM